jgi:hypothetical protein
VGTCKALSKPEMIYSPTHEEVKEVEKAFFIH